MTPRARWGAVTLWLAPLGAWALGLGDIELKSALNQPLEADIFLVSATPEEVGELRATLAAPETFDRYGLDRPAFLAGLQFEVTQNNVGRDIIRVTSQDSITEPFVTMLVEAVWTRGRLLREYTLLLDPPVLLPAPTVTETVQPAQTRTREPTQAAATIDRPAPQPVEPVAEPAPQAVRQPLPQSIQPVPQPIQQPTSQPAVTPTPRPAVAQSSGAYGPIQRGETLWGVAERFRPAGVTMNQMMVAMYQANPQAFNGNMNLLLEGVTLTVPEAGEVQQLTAAEATQEAVRQTAEWEGAPVQQARLRLVPAVEEGGASAAIGGASAAETAALEGENNALRSELDETRRLLELRDEQLQELQAQLSEPQAEAEPAGELLGELPATAAGVDLESEELFADELAVEPEAVAAGLEPAESEVVVEEPAQPPAAISVVSTAPSEPSLVSRVLGWVTNPLLLIVLGLLALVGTAVWYLRHRQEAEEDVTGRWEALEAEVDEDEANREATQRMRAQIKEDDENFVVVEQPALQEAPEPDEPAPVMLEESGLFDEQPVATDETLSSQTVINLDKADPVAEADFHMAYGLYDQAAELVSKALEVSPDRRDLKLKLLEVFFVWGNKEAFLDAAQSLRTEMGDSPDQDWDKVVIMGKQVCPDEGIFKDARAVASEVDVDLEAGDSPELDLALDAGIDADSGEVVDLDLGDIGGEDVDLELEATGERKEASGELPEEELDIGSQTAAGLEAALLGVPGVDASAQTAPNLGDSDNAATQESPTIETPLAPTVESPELEASAIMEIPDFLAASETPTLETEAPEPPTVETAAVDAPTAETPTIETMAADAPTMETPTIETPGPGEPTMESPTIESPLGGTNELPTIEQPALAAATGEASESTAEIDLDDLGLDVKDLDDLPADLGELDEADTQERVAVSPDDELLSATGITQVLQEEDLDSQLDDLEHVSTAVIGDEEATMLAPGYERTDVLEKPVDLIAAEEQSGATSLVQALPAAESGLDLDLDDLSAALDGGATVEQPGQSFSSDVFAGGGQTDVDLDVGADVAGSEEPTATQEISPLDPQTMTEVGTKLDLARAYIDMGDPEGARSILEEVVDEGDSGQQQEAKTLNGAL